LTLFRPRDTRNLLWPGRFLKCTTQFLGLQWKNHHQEEEKEDIITKSKKSLITPGPAVVVINHQSSLDVLGLVTEIWPLLEGQCTVVSKKSLLYAGPFGLMAYMSGVIFIDRKKGRESRQCLHEAVQWCKEQNLKLVIFPEGTRHHDPKIPDMLPFKLGAFTSAIHAQIPIQPIVFSHYDFYNSRTKLLNPGQINIDILEPISPEGLEESDANELAEKTRQIMLENFTKPYEIEKKIYK